MFRIKFKWTVDHWVKVWIDQQESSSAEVRTRGEFETLDLLVPVREDRERVASAQIDRQPARSPSPHRRHFARRVETGAVHWILYKRVFLYFPRFMSYQIHRCRLHALGTASKK